MPPDNIYFGLRNQILQARGEQLGLPVNPHPTDPWAVVMDWGLANGIATVVAISDGTASVYLSSGGGSIGGGQSHESIRKAARNAVSVAAEFQPQMQPSPACPLPHKGEVIFYALTDAGIFTAKASEAELSAHRHSLSKLGDALQEIITSTVSSNRNNNPVPQSGAGFLAALLFALVSKQSYGKNIRR
jgi:hypothetical protein